MRASTLAVLLCLAASPALAKPPRLTLLISVDGFSSDVLQRGRPRLKAGFATLLTQGAFFPTARYQAAECVTAAGHATLSTGATPSRHGIVGNRLYNRATGKVEPTFADPAHPALDAPLNNDDVSPARLVAETLADRVRLSTWRRGKAVSVSGKGRSAIPLAGKLGDAWWFQETIGRFVTSTWYKKETPAWVKTWNDKKIPDSYHAKTWDLLAPAKEYFGDDDRPFESDWYGMGRTFPHPLNGGLPAPGGQSYSALASSPMMNDVLVDFAKAAIDGEQLGKDDVPDLLAVSFSPFDRTYHLYGPYSWEMQDQLVRLDKSIGDLIAAAEKAAGGRQNLVVVLAADHGGAAVPEEWAAIGLEGVRVPPALLQKGLNDALEAKFKVPALVAAIEETDIYLDLKAVADKKLDAAAVRKATAEWLAKQPDVQVALSKEDLENGAAGPYVDALRAEFFPERSGDVLMVMRPFHVLESEPRGTSHGTPYTYDTDVPLMLLGRGVKPGYYPNIVYAVDIATTTAALMEMGLPAMAEGRVLSEALQMSAR